MTVFSHPLPRPDAGLSRAANNATRFCDDMLLVWEPHASNELADFLSQLSLPLVTSVDLSQPYHGMQLHAPIVEPPLRFGLQVDEAKTEGPSQRIEFFGVGLDSTSQTTFVPDDEVAS